ncbi:hypothetical protein HYC85_029569 [Camellia sinensis]|uniref:Uncharacterized protein n=1 Tax=Camellia sinensis TaxID=4442 RepID=A0A7J7G0T7_CAMSI|nr:hypothetical protein HYC85_029569 [Camellia sinensis]
MNKANKAKPRDNEEGLLMKLNRETGQNIPRSPDHQIKTSPDHQIKTSPDHQTINSADLILHKFPKFCRLTDLSPDQHPQQIKQKPRSAKAAHLKI